MHSFIEEYILPVIFTTITFFASIIGWVFSRQITKIDSISSDLESHKLYISKNYATHDDISELKVGLYKRWDRLEDKVESIALQMAGNSVTRTQFDEYRKDIEKKHESLRDQFQQRINKLEKTKQDKK